MDMAEELERYREINGKRYDIYTDNEGNRYVDMSFTQGILNLSQFNSTGMGGADNLGALEGVTIGYGKRAEAARALGFSEHPTQQECASKMVTIKVETAHNGNMGITVHKDLAENVKQIFKEIKQSGFNVYMIAGYCYRQINNPKNKSATRPLSMHSFGCAIDINWDVNPFIANGKPLTSGDTNTEIRTYNHPVVRAMAKYGFGWGGRYGDYMHFSTANGS